MIFTISQAYQIDIRISEIIQFDPILCFLAGIVFSSNQSHYQKNGPNECGRGGVKTEARLSVSEWTISVGPLPRLTHKIFAGHRALDSIFMFIFLKSVSPDEEVVPLVGREIKKETP